MAKIDTYSAKYQFIGDDTFLIATIEPETKKQHLIFQKINTPSNEVEFTEKLECIHTALTKISYDRYSELMQNPEKKQEFAKDVLNVKSSEKIKVIDLDIDEKFFAFKSWVQGIAEAGQDFLQFQTDIDIALGRSLPIAQFLLRCLIRADSSFLFQFLCKIEKECKFEGRYHETSIIASLQLFRNVSIEIREEKHPIKYNEENLHCLTNFFVFLSNQKAKNRVLFGYVLKYFINIDLKFILKFLELIQKKKKSGDYDQKIDLKKIYMMILEQWISCWHWDVDKGPELLEGFNREILVNFLYKIAELNPKYVFKFREGKESFLLRIILAMQVEFTDFPEYKHLFFDPNFYVRRNIMKNPRSSQFSEFKSLYPSEWGYHIQDVLNHDNLTSFREYELLFNDEQKEVRRIIAERLESVKFSQYVSFFTDNDWVVRENAAQNPEAVKLPQYSVLFTDKNSLVLYQVAANKNSPSFPEYRKLFTNEDKDIRLAVAENPNTVHLPEYSLLESDQDTIVLKATPYFKESYSRGKSAEFPFTSEFSLQVTVKLEQEGVIIQLLRNRHKYHNPNQRYQYSCQSYDMDTFFAIALNLVREVSKSGMDIFRQKYFHSRDSGFIEFLIQNIANLNPNFINQYYTSIKDLPNDIRKKNLRDFFGSIIQVVFFKHDTIIKKKKRKILLKIAELDEEYLFRYTSKNSYFGNRETEDLKSFLASEEGFTVFKEYRTLFAENEKIRKNIAANINAVTLPEFITLFADENSEVRQKSAENPNAPSLPEYKYLFLDENYFIRHSALKNLNAARFKERDLLFPLEWGDNVDRILDQHPEAVNYPEFKMLFLDERPEIRYTLSRRFKGKNPYYSEFQFVESNIFLIAKVDHKTKMRELGFLKLEPSTNNIKWEHYMDCGVIETSLRLLSINNSYIFDLELEGKFNIFKSLIQRIAEAGKDFPKLRVDIERNIGVDKNVIEFLRFHLGAIGYIAI